MTRFDPQNSVLVHSYVKEDLKNVAVCDGSASAFDKACEFLRQGDGYAEIDAGGGEIFIVKREFDLE